MPMHNANTKSLTVSDIIDNGYAIFGDDNFDPTNPVSLSWPWDISKDDFVLLRTSSREPFKNVMQKRFKDLPANAVYLGRGLKTKNRPSLYIFSLPGEH